MIKEMVVGQGFTVPILVYKHTVLSTIQERKYCVHYISKTIDSYKMNNDKNEARICTSLLNSYLCANPESNIMHFIKKELSLDFTEKEAFEFINDRCILILSGLDKDYEKGIQTPLGKVLEIKIVEIIGI